MRESVQVVGDNVDDEQTTRALKKLLFYSLLIIIVPIFLYFFTKAYIFEMVLSMTGTNSYFYAAIVAILAVHIILAFFVYAAWTESDTPKPMYKAE